MLTAEGCAARRRRLWEALPEPCDALVVADPRHLIALANFAPSPFTFRSNDAGALLLLEPGKATLVADGTSKHFLAGVHVDEVVAPTWYDGKNPAPLRPALRVGAALRALGGSAGLRLGIEPSAVPAGFAEGVRASRPGVEWVDIEPSFRALRRAKDPDEVALLRRSLRAIDAGHAAALAGLEPGLTEFDAFLLVQRAALEAIGQPAVVYGDFDAGPRGRPDLSASADRTLRRGDLFLLDFSVVVHGYRGDTANTIAVGGASTSQQQERAEGCLAALEAGEAMLRPGVSAREVDAAVRRAFADRGLDPDFPTHTGHGVGLGHPEPPFLVAGSDEVLAPGDVVTLEPGQYGPDFGAMRFERNYLITADGFETLSSHRIALA